MRLSIEVTDAEWRAIQQRFARASAGGWRAYARPGVERARAFLHDSLLRGTEDIAAMVAALDLE